MDHAILLWLAAVALVAVGLAGLALPALPGAPVLFAGLLLAAWIDDFTYVGAGTLAVLGVLTILTYVVDFIAGAFGAKRFGASRRGVVGSFIGALVGLFFGIPGLLLGPFIGAVLGELSMQRSLGAAGRSGVGATLGLVIGSAAKLALAFSMIGLFATVRFLSSR